MKSKKKFLSVLIIVVVLIVSQVVPVLASYDGPLRMTYVDGLYMRSDHNTSASIIMTMGIGEAITNNGSNSYYDGYYYWNTYMGWKSSTGSMVSGWVAESRPNQTYVASPSIVEAKYALNLYSSESDSSWTGAEVAAGSQLNPEYGHYTYSYMYFYDIDYWMDPQGAWHYTSGYVHTNFRTSSPSNYYLKLTPLS